MGCFLFLKDFERDTILIKTQGKFEVVRAEGTVLAQNSEKQRSCCS